MTKLSDGLTHLICNWKSTVSGLLTIVLAIASSLLGAGKVTIGHGVSLLTVAAVCKAVIAVMQKDPH